MIPRLRKDADEEIAVNRWSQAVDDLTKAISYGADDGMIWLRLSQAQYGQSGDNVMATAYMAYTRLSDKPNKAEALFVIGRELDRHREIQGGADRVPRGARAQQSRPAWPSGSRNWRSLSPFA